MPRNVFISYHHGNDQFYCDEFRRIFCNDFDNIFADNSLQRALNSDNATYIDRTVREQYIYGSSVTIVLCGRDTPLRKFIDWEINDTLLYNHGLLGIILPSVERTSGNYWTPSTPILPPRLQDNVTSGYAHIIDWNNNHLAMRSAVEQAIAQKSLAKKRNDRAHMQRNGYRRSPF